jgi:hypothetical protein
MPRTPDRFREFARIGAAVRLAQLREEVQQIYKAFPSLRFQRRGALDTKQARDGNTKSAAPQRRKRRALTAAEKKAISDRMKKYWAERKKKS